MTAAAYARLHEGHSYGCSAMGSASGSCCCQRVCSSASFVHPFVANARAPSDVSFCFLPLHLRYATVQHEHAVIQHMWEVGE